MRWRLVLGSRIRGRIHFVTYSSEFKRTNSIAVAQRRRLLRRCRRDRMDIAAHPKSVVANGSIRLRCVKDEATRNDSGKKYIQ